MELGLLSLPVILIGEQKLTGFNPNKIDEAIKTLGFAPEWVAGPNTNAQVRRALSITPQMRAFIASYVKNAKK